MDKNVEAFVVHVTSLSLNSMLIYPVRAAQIALLIAKKVKILTNYLDFSNVFSEEKALVLLEITDLNQHAIKLQESQQSLYRPMCNLGLVKLKMLKTYIKRNLEYGFI